MSDFTIGVFDSGMGGLTAVSALTELAPYADIVYFGDTGHMPYGGRERAEILYMARRNVAFLEGKGAKLVLAACGTVTSVALDIVAKETATPLFGVALPAAEKAAALTKNKIIGFIATSACVDSGFNQELLAKTIPGAKIIARACPKFVPLIENGVTDSPELRADIEEALADIKAAGADVLILGCTHYPLIAKAIGRYMGGDVALVSSSGEAAAALAARLCKREAASRPKGRRIYYTSGNAAFFRETAEKLLGTPLDGPVTALEPYPLIF